ncbi:hypothetical protein NE237_007227 [Protea cynaroides]|uniref:Uncharacterized protein n=1 Tax=Protea cynaroides TaxID=273540 RepID=A0A9Q0QW15_9MAGN|nr:hypothetical protein NE237_007227 [Protea cynaroides]
MTAESSEGPTTRDLLCNAGAGGAAGAIAATFVCPLDVIKTRLQVHGLPQVPHTGHKGSLIIVSLQNIIKNEGVRGMYRGLSPTILALLPNWAVYFTIYEHLKGLLHSHVDQNKQLTLGANVAAASGAGAATAIMTNPLWVVKTRLQTQGMRPDVVPYNSVVSALRRIVHEEGIRGLYSGILPSLVGVSHVAIQFPAYEKIKSYLARRDNTTVDKLSTGHVAIASSIAKILASTMTYPHEVVRARLQEQGQARNSQIHYAGVVDCIKKVFQKEGVPGFYRGCATNLLRTTPAAVITFTSFEMIQRLMRRVLPPEQKHSLDQPKSDGHVKPNQENGGSREKNDDGMLQPSQEQKELAVSFDSGMETSTGLQALLSSRHRYTTDNGLGEPTAMRRAALPFPWLMIVEGNASTTPSVIFSVGLLGLSSSCSGGEERNKSLRVWLSNPLLFSGGSESVMILCRSGDSSRCNLRPVPPVRLSSIRRVLRRRRWMTGLALGLRVWLPAMVQCVASSLNF